MTTRPASITDSGVTSVNRVKSGIVNLTSVSSFHCNLFLSNPPQLGLFCRSTRFFLSDRVLLLKTHAPHASYRRTGPPVMSFGWIRGIVHRNTLGLPIWPPLRR